MKAPIALAIVVAVLAACDQSGGGGAAPPPAAVPAPTPAGSTAPAPGTATLAPAPPGAPTAPAEIDWSTVAPAPERDGRLALYGIIRQMDLKRFEDTGWDILSFEPGAGPSDRLANVYSPVTVMGDTFEVTPSHWLAIFNTVDGWRAKRGEDFMARPMPDARYGDEERSERDDLIFAFVVEDRAAMTLKVVWSRQ
jgi:hypothetical protein